MRKKGNENGSDKPKNEKGTKNVQTLKTKNMEVFLKRIEEAQRAAKSSDDSPFVSGSEDNDDVMYNL